MLNLDARVSAGNSTWKDQSGNSRDATVSGTMGISDRCVALYNFHSDATDLTGNYTGTETNITYASGNYGQAAVFNGSSSKIDLPNLGTSVSGSNARTVSLWVNLDHYPSAGEVLSSAFSMGTASSNASFIISLTTTGAVRVSGYNNDWITTETISTNTWANIVAVYRGGAFETSANSDIYIDGNLATKTHTGGSTGSLNTTNSNYSIGNYDVLSLYYFDGSIDQVRLFNRAITPEEVTSLYNENSSTFKKVDIFNDAVAGYYTLDSTDSFYTSQFITDQTFTIGGWFYRATAGGSAGSETLWAQGYSPSVRCQVYGAAGASTGDRLYIYLHNGSTGVSYNTNIDLPTAEWFHLMKTYDMSTGSVKVYLNGALKLTQSTITGNIYSASNSDPYFRIAKNSTNANGYINGRISQVRVYDSILTDEQVLDDYTTHDYLYT
jgi:hypothetical protein